MRRNAVYFATLTYERDKEQVDSNMCFQRRVISDLLTFEQKVQSNFNYYQAL